jgi:hypothetical protein
MTRSSLTLTAALLRKPRAFLSDGEWDSFGKGARSLPRRET